MPTSFALHLWSTVIVTIALTHCEGGCDEPCIHAHPVVAGGTYERIGAEAAFLVFESSDASVVGTAFPFDQPSDVLFSTDWNGGSDCEIYALAHAPVTPQCYLFNMPQRLPLDGSTFTMFCSMTFPYPADAELHLRYEIDSSLPPIKGIGPAGRFVGEYRNGAEVYSVVITNLWGVSDHCASWDD